MIFFVKEGKVKGREAYHGTKERDSQESRQ
jgi:hypothetical protein